MSRQISKLFKKTRLRFVFSTHFSVFAYLMKHSLQCLMYCTKIEKINEISFLYILVKRYEQFFHDYYLPALASTPNRTPSRRSQVQIQSHSHTYLWYVLLLAAAVKRNKKGGRGAETKIRHSILIRPPPPPTSPPAEPSSNV